MTTPAEFIDQLGSGALEPPPPELKLVGVAGRREGDSDRIYFGRSCAAWMPVPVMIIEGMQMVGWSGCSGHEHHPLVRLHLKEPRSEEGQAFAELAASSIRSCLNAVAPPPMPRMETATPSKFPGGGSSITVGLEGSYWFGVWCLHGCGFIIMHLYEHLAWNDAEQHWRNMQHRCVVRRLIFGDPTGYYG
ncbi:hypothetical protein [Streptomyces pseudogriseolus]|uniref:hypothetical protein n=1 Tax=Streptomyces pseudogriseolus TaxID=36817 RepID=UPI003FA20B3C